jgi:hypothetical protein
MTFFFFENLNHKTNLLTIINITNMKNLSNSKLKLRKECITKFSSESFLGDLGIFYTIPFCPKK